MQQQQPLLLPNGFSSDVTSKYRPRNSSSLCFHNKSILLRKKQNINDIERDCNGSHWSTGSIQQKRYTSYSIDVISHIKAQPDYVDEAILNELTSDDEIIPQVKPKTKPLSKVKTKPSSKVKTKPLSKASQKKVGNTIHETTKATIPDTVEKRRRRPLRKQAQQSVSLQRLYAQVLSEKRWNENFQKFQKFVQEQNALNIDKNTIRFMMPQDKKLRKWLVRMRMEYQRKLQGQPTRLTDARVDQLRQCGFSFLTTPIVVSWDLRYQQLVQFLNDHNGRYPHEFISSLSKEDMELYQWCNRQRILRKAFNTNDKRENIQTHISDERIAKLDKINFLWSINELQWQERYNELKQYYTHHGNCMVPARYVSNPKLARWVETQRRQFMLLNKKMPSQLTEERFALLNKLNFEWDAYETRWVERYNELLEFQRLNGDGVLPTHNSGRTLYRWLLSQRHSYQRWITGKPCKMNEHRRDRLESRGVRWTIELSKKKKKKKKKDLIDSSKEEDNA